MRPLPIGVVAHLLGRASPWPSPRDPGRVTSLRVELGVLAISDAQVGSVVEGIEGLRLQVEEHQLRPGVAAEKCCVRPAHLYRSVSS